MRVADDLLKKLYEEGCPTYLDNSGSRSNDGCVMCHYCRENLDRYRTHTDDCLWLEIERYLESLSSL